MDDDEIKDLKDPSVGGAPLPDPLTDPLLLDDDIPIPEEEDLGLGLSNRYGDEEDPYSDIDDNDDDY